MFVILFTSSFCSGQTDHNKFNADSSKTIPKETFDNLVDSSIKLIQTKEISEISDSGNINIMICFNTIFMRKFKDGRYQKLLNLIEEKNYMKDIIKVYPEWIPNRGMGFYFPKLKMEFGGTPRRYAIFNVTK
jgi:hypothetical protein